MRGSGGSRDLQHPHGPFSVAQFAADAGALLTHLGAAPAHLVGLSMGGMIAFQLAVDRPELVRSLTIVNSGPALVAKTPREHLLLFTRRVLARWLGPVRMAKLLAPKLFPKPEHEALRAEFIAGFAQNEPKAYLATTLALMGWSVDERIGAITAPTLVVSADADYTPVSAKQAYARRMQRAEVVVVPDSHHALPAEAPERFNAVLEQFLRRQG